MVDKRGYKNGYSGPDFSSIPSGERFNPYDYISQDDYRGTKRGQAAYQEDLARLQYLADLAQQDWQNAYNEARVADDREYNSFANQAQLMRDAGLNPDLLGVSPGTSQSAPSVDGSDVKTNPMAGMPTNLQTAGNIVSIIGSVAQTAMSLYSGGLSIIGQSLNNAASLFSVVNSAYGTTDNVVGTALDAGLASAFPLSRSMRKRLERFYNQENRTERSNSKRFRLFADKMSNEKDYYTKKLNPLEYPRDYDNDDFISESDWSYVWEPIFQKQAEILENQLDASSKRSETDVDRADYESSELETVSALREPFKEVVKRMKDKYDEGSDFWGYALSALYVLLNSSMSFSKDKKGKSSFSFGF